MSEQNKNPYDPDNFIDGGGGGLWDNKIVTILSSKTGLDPMMRGDGTPVLDDKGEPTIRHSLILTGIADGEEKERRQAYSAGKTFLPTADGEGFDRAEGQPFSGFYKSSELFQFMEAVKSSGFDMSLLWVDGKSRLSALTGARFRFKGVARLDKDGKPKKNAKGYEVQNFFPVEFLGFKDGVAAATGGVSNAAALREKAIGVVVGILSDAGGKISRAELVRKLSSKLNGDTDCNKILALVTRDDFHKDVPWTRDGTSYSL